MTPWLLTTIAAARETIAAERAHGRTVALVPTMGALHDGHLALVEAAAGLADTVVVSIFVNPLQFGPGEDFDRYPRTLDADLAALAAGAAGRESTIAVFAPTPAEMYPHGAPATTVHAGPVALELEGAVRPGHFDGMLTVVTKLLLIVQPDVAVFGKKDAQQLFLVRQAVADLNIPTRIEGHDIVREPDGLARSSRNRYLSAAQRGQALVLSRALADAASTAPHGVEAALAAARARLAQEPSVILDYLAFVDPATFAPVPDTFRGEALALIAARVGETRLIDNASISF